MSDVSPSPADIQPPSFAAALRVWLRIGLLSFGGPAAQIAVMHREVVERHGWCDDRRFLRGLNFCLLLPGPEAQQLATWLGWRMHGAAGGLAAGALFVLPGALVMHGLTVVYLLYDRTPAVAGGLYGLRAVVVALVGHALVRMGSRVLRDTPRRLVAVAACAAVVVWDVPFLVVIAAAALVALVAFRPVSAEDATGAPEAALPPAPGWRRTLGVLLFGLAAWWGPVVATGVVLGAQHRLTHEGWWFGRLATLSFGGAYAVLAWMRQEAVDTLGWITPGEMADALSLAETTPGPLILVTQFVGAVAAARESSPLSPLAAANWGAVLVTWVTFAPSFLWIALGRHGVDRISERSLAGRALEGVSAAVVGVIATLALALSRQAFFTQAPTGSDPFSLAAVRPWALLLALLAGAALSFRRAQLGWVLLAGVLAGPVARTLDGG